MKIRFLIITAILIGIICGCTAAETTDEIIPTKNLPGGMTFEISRNVTQMYSSWPYLKKATCFFYSHPNKNGTGNTNVILFELNKEISDRDIGGVSEGSSLKEEIIQLEGIDLKHIYKITHIENSTEIMGTIDFYYIKLNNSAIIEVESYETPYKKNGEYDEFGLKIAEKIVENIVRNKNKE